MNPQLTLCTPILELEKLHVSVGDGVPSHTVLGYLIIFKKQTLKSTSLKIPSDWFGNRTPGPGGGRPLLTPLGHWDAPGLDGVLPSRPEDHVLIKPFPSIQEKQTNVPKGSHIVHHYHDYIHYCFETNHFVTIPVLQIVNTEWINVVSLKLPIGQI